MKSPDREFITAQLQKITTELHHLQAMTAQASSTILDCCDRLSAQYPAQEDITHIYETCAMQDITEQRINKILRILARIENPDLPEDDALLQGPQSGDAALSQEETDRLMQAMEEKGS